MKVNFYFNQQSSGGAVDSEFWSLIPDSEFEVSPFFSIETLRTVTVELPDGYEVDKERDMLFNENGDYTYFKELSRDWNKIIISIDTFPYGQTIWKEGE